MPLSVAVGEPEAEPVGEALREPLPEGDAEALPEVVGEGETDADAEPEPVAVRETERVTVTEGELEPEAVAEALPVLEALLLLAASVSGKLLGVQLAGRILGWQKGEASVIGWLLQTKALIEIIFANILLDKGVITSGTFTALLFMALASTMLTVPMVSPKLARMRQVLGKSG